MTFEEATRYLFSSFPSFEKSGKTGINEGLSITRKLLSALGNPHHDLSCVHIAGTNGKGSSSHFLASILQESGYKTGLFTSPHIHSFTERIRVDGIPIPEQRVVDFILTHRALLDRLKPSFFEITTALAFQYFKESHTDIVVVETGLGGRLDSTNVLKKPLVCLITNVGLDHMDMLGDSVQEIAAEKAGIVKENVPVVLSEYNQEYASVIQQKAFSMHAPFVQASSFWSVKYQGWENGCGIFEIEDLRHKLLHRLKTPLAGLYQALNLGGVLEVCEVLKASGKAIPWHFIEIGIQRVIENTGMKGRWQTLSQEPLIICDAVHNYAGWLEVKKQLVHMPQPCGVMVLGFAQDKNPKQFIDSIPEGLKVIFSGFNNKRATAPQFMLKYAQEKGMEAYAVEQVNEAIQKAIAILPKGSFIFVGGSIYLLSEVSRQWTAGSGQ